MTDSDLGSARLECVGVGRWRGVDVMPYKPSGTHFQSISRQLLFGGDADLAVEIRYFEIDPGGYSTLERHEHTHWVMVLEGSGRALVGEEVMPLRPHDIVRISAWTWHQFRGDDADGLGILCVVSAERDRPSRPTDADLEQLKKRPEVAEFIRV
jgi:quercetin dioxygenase-like cupin family protein